MFKVRAFTKADVSAEYRSFCTAFGIEDGTVPDEPDSPAVTLTSISATYSGGKVSVGTPVNALSGIVVTARYSDGSTARVSGYTLSGTIKEGSNTITVRLMELTIDKLCLTTDAQFSTLPLVPAWEDADEVGSV